MIRLPDHIVVNFLKEIIDSGYNDVTDRRTDDLRKRHRALHSITWYVVVVVTNSLFSNLVVSQAI